MAITRTKPFKDNKSGMVYLVSTPIGNIKDISSRAIEILTEADIVASEDTRNSGLLLSRLGIKPKKLISCYSQKEESVAQRVLVEVKENNLTLAFISDAGTPGISDPGALLIKKAIEMDIKVSCVLGPAAFIQGLILSGFDTSDFSFYGFLPVKDNEQKSYLETLVNREETLIFYEAPHRIFKTLANMKEVFGENRRLVIARELSKMFEEYIRGTFKEVMEIDKESIKGEFVIVVEGNKETTSSLNDLAIIKKAEALMKSGYSKSDIAKILSLVLELSKNYVYNLIKDI